MAKKQYENFMVFGARIYGMRNLWEPSREYKGQPVQKPNYLAGFMVPKTQGHWSAEPVLQDLFAKMQKIHSAALSQLPYQTPGLWPIRDGDEPQDPNQPPAEWARGQWMFSGNSGDPIKVEMQQGSALVPLQARANLVKPGDYCIVGGAAAVNSQSNRSIKLYINNVVFTAPGEEIAIGNSVSGAELMEAAHRQGYKPMGFSASSAGGGFSASSAGGGFGGGQQGGFTGHGSGGGFAPTQGGGAQAGFANPPNNGAGSGFASPSSAPQGFGQAAPANNPFGPR